MRRSTRPRRSGDASGVRAHCFDGRPVPGPRPGVTRGVRMDWEPTRRSLHGVAELLLAGPQHRATGRIDLAVTDGGFATAGRPARRVEGAELLTGSGRLRLAGRTYAEVAAEAGIEAGEPAGVYSGGPGVRPDETIVFADGALTALLRAFTDGD